MSCFRYQNLNNHHNHHNHSYFFKSNDFSVNIGTTNNNGNGTSINLNDSHTVLNSSGYIATEDYFASQYLNNIIVVATAWDSTGAKEVQINATNQHVFIHDIVDVDINLQDSTKDINVILENVKRGQIDTGTGDDLIDVSITSNSWGWSNVFNVNSGKGDDIIKFSDSENSQYTHLYINAGSGHDFIDIRELNARFSADQRIIDGGNGNDRIFGSEGDETLIGGKGNDYINAAGGNNIIDSGNGRDTISSGSGNDIVDAGAGKDYIHSGNGNDFINGGEGRDYIWAEDGNDTVVFDSVDKFVDGGSGFDALIIKDIALVDNNYVNFEAIIGERYTAQNIEVGLSDGMIILLGNDIDDSLTFTNADYFSASGEILTLTIEQENIFVEQGFNLTDISHLQGFEDTVNGNIVWTDINLV